MSIIDNQLREWRLRMLQKEAFKTEDLDELESHLREEIGSLSQKGLDAEESFLVAAHRLGDGERLGTEFLKINGGIVWKQRIFWMVGGYFLINFIFVLLNVVQYFYLSLTDWGTLPMFIVSPDRFPIIPIGLAILFFCLLYVQLAKGSFNSVVFARLIPIAKQHKGLSICLLLMVLVITLLGWPVFNSILARYVSIHTVGSIVLINSFSKGILQLLLAAFFVGLAARFFSGMKQKTEAQSE